MTKPVVIVSALVLSFGALLIGRAGAPAAETLEPAEPAREVATAPQHRQSSAPNPAPVQPESAATPIAAAEEPEQEPLADMTLEQLESTVEQLESELEQSHAIDQLNQEDMAAGERDALGVVFERLVRMKQRIIDLRIEQISRNIAEYERDHHAARVAQYVGQNP